MIDNKTKNDILLEERIAKIDDINFDKIYDVDEFAEKQLETFEETTETSNYQIANISDSQNGNNSFELELQPNEFLDTMVWGEDEEIEQVNLNKKFKLQNKPLFFTFTSIAVLLCILFIYNVFVIRSLENGINATASAQQNPAHVALVAEETNSITINNSNTIEIQNNQNYIKTPNNKSQTEQTNWFNSVCSYLNELFGGNY